MNGLIISVGMIFILWIGRSIFVPILIATFLWYLINAISAYYRKVMPYNKYISKKLPPASIAFDWLSKILSITTFAGLIYLFITQIQPMFSELAARIPEIQQKLNSLGGYFSNYFGFQFDPESLPNLQSIVSSIGSAAAGFAKTVGLILIYIVFMFIEQSTFTRKFDTMFKNKTQLKKFRYILQSIDENMKKYMFMKTIISGATAIISFLWLRYLGIEFAGVWAFIIFIMNYIPTFGSIVACSLPILYSLITANAMNTPVFVAIGLISIQVFLGNIIEPKLTGKTLNLSTLGILINLVFWGMLWGVAGMFFSVPILVAVFIITAQFDSVRPIAVLLSANGEIPEKSE